MLENESVKKTTEKIERKKVDINKRNRRGRSAMVCFFRFNGFFVEWNASRINLSACNNYRNT